MTITPRVVKACVPLFERVSSFEELLALDDEELRAIIKPVAHYNRKTTNLKIMCQQILRDFDGHIPDTHEDLMKLQGVGRKVADIMMNFIFGQDTIAVDTRTARSEPTRDRTHRRGEEAADQINALTPGRYKRHAHEWLIQHGMQMCTARNPRCNGCCVANLSPLHSGQHDGRRSCPSHRPRRSTCCRKSSGLSATSGCRTMRRWHAPWQQGPPCASMPSS